MKHTDFSKMSSEERGKLLSASSRDREAMLEELRAEARLVAAHAAVEKLEKLEAEGEEKLGKVAKLVSKVKKSAPVGKEQDDQDA